MTSYVMDTGILLGYIRGAGYASYVESRFAVSEPPNIALISVITVGEIYSLALQFNWGEDKKKKLNEIIQKIPTIDINSRQILKRYAEIDAYSQGKHASKKLPPSITARNMGKNDIWIAATGSVLKALLLTTDHDFDHLNGVFLEVRYIDPTLRGSSG
jgi:PIN domain.